MKDIYLPTLLFIFFLVLSSKGFTDDYSTVTENFPYASSAISMSELKNNQFSYDVLEGRNPFSKTTTKTGNYKSITIDSDLTVKALIRIGEKKLCIVSNEAGEIFYLSPGDAILNGWVETISDKCITLVSTIDGRKATTCGNF